MMLYVIFLFIKDEKKSDSERKKIEKKPTKLKTFPK